MRSRLSPSPRRSSTKPDFGRVAGRYDELRPADENWWELFELLVREGDLVGRRVLDIGCGTGRAAAALAERGSRVWGVEPEPEMAARARERLSTVKVAPAERLPFKDGWFDRALMWLVVHLVDRPRALAEAWRVLAPDGRLAIATFHWDYFDDHWLGAFFPSLEQIDRAQFSRTEDLVRRARGGRLRLGVAHAPQPAGVGEPGVRPRARAGTLRLAAPAPGRGRVPSGPRAHGARAAGDGRVHPRLARRRRRSEPSNTLLLSA